MASVATMTGTLIDSGCKHIIPVRVCQDTLLQLMEAPDSNVLLREKMRFCAHKGDLLVSVGRAMFVEGDGRAARSIAYPRVISTLGDAPDIVREAVAIMYHHAKQVFESKNPLHMLKFLTAYIINKQAFNDILARDDITAENAPEAGDQDALVKHRLQRVGILQNIPNFRFMGFSLGLGYAHPSSGDNTVSSMIGGMISVRNGHFHVCTGDLVMWYFEFEAEMFDRDGKRATNLKEAVKLKADDKQRKAMFERQNGSFGDAADRHTGKRWIALPKPFLQADSELGALDHTRVFGKAVSNARPFDVVDLLVCTQCV